MPLFRLKYAFLHTLYERMHISFFSEIRLSNCNEIKCTSWRSILFADSSLAFKVLSRHMLIEQKALMSADILLNKI